MNQMQSMMNQTTTAQKVDYLKVDPSIPGQKFACVSFVEPTNKELLTNRESFFATRFLKGFVEEFKQAMEYQQTEGEDKMTEEMTKKLDLSYENVRDSFYNFRKMALTQLQEDWENLDVSHEATVLRGLKVRGTFPTHSAATQHAESLRQTEPAFHVFVTQVGYWVPFNPTNVDEIKAHYDEDDLNQLVESKVKEDQKRQLDYLHRKRQMMEEASKESEELKQKNGEEMKALKQIEEEVEEIDDEDLLEILLSDNEEETVEAPKVEEVKPQLKKEKKSKTSQKKKNKKRNARKQSNKRKVNRQ